VTPPAAHLRLRIVPQVTPFAGAGAENACVELRRMPGNGPSRPSEPRSSSGNGAVAGVFRKCCRGNTLQKTPRFGAVYGAENEEVDEVLPLEWESPAAVENRVRRWPTRILAKYVARSEGAGRALLPPLMGVDRVSKWQSLPQWQA
jgi:hypothetical protein